MLHQIYAILVILSWGLLLWPFPVEVFLAACFACILCPVYAQLLTRVKKKHANAIITLGLVVGIILPLSIIVMMVIPQAANGIKILNNLRTLEWISGPEMQEFYTTIDVWLKKIPGLEGGMQLVTEELASFLAGFVQNIVSQGLGIAGFTMNFVVRLCVLISLSLVGILYAAEMASFIKIITRFPADVLQRFTQTIREAIWAVLWGVLLVACIQGILCGIGFLFVELPGATFWGFMATLVAPIPLVGTGIVWLPAVIYVWFSVSKGAAVGLFFWCVIVVVGADNFLRPMFLRGGLKATFAVVLIAVLCGLVAFGPVGVVAGPVLAAFALQASREVYRSDN